MVFAGVSSGESIMEMSKIVNDSFPKTFRRPPVWTFCDAPITLDRFRTDSGYASNGLVKERAERWAVWCSFFRFW